MNEMQGFGPPFKFGNISPTQRANMWQVQKFAKNDPICRMKSYRMMYNKIMVMHAIAVKRISANEQTYKQRANIHQVGKQISK